MFARLVLTGLICTAATTLFAIYMVMDINASPVPEGIALAAGVLMLLSAGSLEWFGRPLGMKWMFVAGLVAALPTFVYFVWWLRRRGAF